MYKVAYICKEYPPILKIRYQSKKDISINKECLYIGYHKCTNTDEIIDVKCTKHDLFMYLSQYHEYKNDINYNENSYLKYVSLLLKFGLFDEKKELKNMKKFIFHDHIYPILSPSIHLEDSNDHHKINNQKRIKYLCSFTKFMDDLIIIPISDPGIPIDPIYKEVYEKMENRRQNSKNFFSYIKQINKTSTTYFKLIFSSCIKKIPFFQSLFMINNNHFYMEHSLNVINKQSTIDAIDIIFSLYINELLKSKKRMYENKKYISINDYTYYMDKIYNTFFILDYFCVPFEDINKIKDEMFSFAVENKKCEKIIEYMSLYYTPDYTHFYNIIKNRKQYKQFIYAHDDYIIVNFNWINLFIDEEKKYKKNKVYVNSSPDQNIQYFTTPNKYRNMTNKIYDYFYFLIKRNSFACKIIIVFIYKNIIYTLFFIYIMCNGNDYDDYDENHTFYANAKKIISTSDDYEYITKYYNNLSSYSEEYDVIDSNKIYGIKIDKNILFEHKIYVDQSKNPEIKNKSLYVNEEDIGEIFVFKDAYYKKCVYLCKQVT